MAARKGDDFTKGGTAEVEARIDQAELMLLQGLSRREVQKIIRQKYNVSLRQATRYVSEAFERWRASALEEDGRSVAERRKQHERMISLALAKASRQGNLNLQLKAIDMMMRLYGTVASNRVEVTGANGGPVDMRSVSTKDLMRLVEDIGPADESNSH